MKNYLVMIINALLLIIIGLYGYIISGSGTALIAPVIGVVLFILAFPVKNENSTVTHIAVGLTVLAMIVFFITGFMRSNYLILIMATVTLIALIFYIMDFLTRKKEREAKKD
jgi:uncharacterized membrane protein (UPF0136 family)